MIEKTFSTKTWAPDGEHKAKEWRKFKEDTINARGSNNGSWFSQTARTFLGK